METSDSVSVYLVGASSCGFTKMAAAELDQADPSLRVQQYGLNDVVARLYCDLPDAAQPAQAQACSMAKNGYPALVACQNQRCGVILDGYYPNYATASAQAIDRYLKQGAFVV